MLVSIMRFGWKNLDKVEGMNMRIETTGNAFQMRRLGERDVDAILALCEGKPAVLSIPSADGDAGDILADVTALPPERHGGQGVCRFLRGKSWSLFWTGSAAIPRRKPRGSGCSWSARRSRGRASEAESSATWPQKPESGGVSGNAARRGQRGIRRASRLDKERV